MAVVPIPPKKGRPTQYPSIKVLNPGGGLNNLISDNLIEDKEASDLNNIQFVESGAPGKTTGKSVWGSGLSNNPKGLATFTSDAGSRFVCTIDGTALVTTTAASGTWTTVSGVTFTASQETTFTQARSKLFIFNGTDGGAWWDGTTLSRPGTIPSAKFSIFYQGVHVAAGTSTNTSRLYLSQPDDATKFTRAAGTLSDSTGVPGATVFSGTTANFIDVQTADGDKITGLAKFKDMLVVFKERAIYSMTLDSSGNPVITPLINYLGAVSHRSIDNVDNDVFYLSRLGWFVLGYEANYLNVVRTNELSARVHPDVETINPANLAKVCSIYSPYRFFSSYPSGGSTTNNKTITYDKRFQAWSKLDIVHANAFTVFVDSTNTQHLLFASDDEAKVYELDSNYSDNGSAISAYWVSKAFDAGQPDLYKRWIDLTLLFRQISGTISITVYADNNAIVHSSSIPSGSVDGGIGQATWGGEVFGGNISSTSTATDSTATSNVPYRIRINTTSRTLKVKVANANNNETFILLGLSLTYRPYSHFKFPSTLKIQ
jgi:hypothetical protein